MSETEEPEWIIAKRESDRSFRSAVVGTWLACLPIGLIMMIVSPFEYGPRMAVAGTLFLLAGLACVFLRRKAKKGSIARAFINMLSVFGVFAAFVTLAAGLAHLS